MTTEDVFKKMKYITYENRNNPHISIHKIGCSQILKNGGNNISGRDGYCAFDTIEKAELYAEATKLELKYCKTCNPKE